MTHRTLQWVALASYAMAVIDSFIHGGITLNGVGDLCAGIFLLVLAGQTKEPE